MKHLSRKAEDYLEAILNITLEKGYARTKDVAQELGVRPPTVVEMIQKLDAMGLAVYRRYEGVTLTPEGRSIAEVIKSRHDTIRAFLTLIRVPAAVADHDACIMEHELSPETIEQLRHFVEFMSNQFSHPDLLREFDLFCAGKRQPQKVGQHGPAQKLPADSAGT
ncbi:MAG: metal-dependent transcriptional regulator [Methanomicrobiaceae archaeon]|uniref:Iron-dependent repressor ider/dtxr n=1 Tax=hydrocarbon metagenome TaxID=938273 RepID=A0A0W8FH07_9ZZZZ|nr:metal-dependent transcriptional regulator [Methanomicrobiaceae archaeon]